VSTLEEYLAAPVPRHLRVRASVQIASTRLPARSFVLVMACLLVGGIGVARGADLTATAQWLGLIAGAGIALLEGRWWGYSTLAFARVLAAHLTRPSRLELERPEIVVAPEIIPPKSALRPRWHQGQEGGRE
jgi:hypothetical protein